MGLRYQKRIQLGKFLRLNISKSGVGASLGVNGLRFTTGPSGTRFTIGMPGTGLHYTKQIGSGKGLRWANFLGGGKKENASKTARQGAAQANEESADDAPSPSFFASREEKALAKGLEAYEAEDAQTALQHFLEVADEEAGAAIMAADILASQSTSQKRRAIPLLEKIIYSDDEIPTSLMQKYLTGAEMDIDITPTINVSVPLEGLAPVLLLTELYQLQGRMDEAIALLEEVEELANAAPLTLSLCELYIEEGLWDGVIDRANQLESTDDVTLGTMILYGRALHGKGLADAAITVYNKALRRTKDRSPELLHEGRYWRAKAYQDAGKGSRARQEWEKLYAENPDYRDVAEQIGA